MLATARPAALALAPFAIAVALLPAGGCSGGGKSTSSPAIASLAPATGTVGTIVTVKGSSFHQAGAAPSIVNPTVTFTPALGGAAVTGTVTAFAPDSLDVAVPAVAATAGAVYDVAVANPDGGSAVTHGAFTMAVPTISALNGALSASGTVNSLFTVDGANFGDLPAAPTSGYSVDFRDHASGAVVATAPVIFTAGDWQDVLVVAAVPASLTASITYDVTVTTPTGTSAPRSFLVAPAVSFSPSTIAWSASTALPTAQQGFPAVVAPVGASSFLYVTGGSTATTTTGGKGANVAAVIYAKVADATGLLGAFTATTPLPAPRGFAAAVAANPFNSLVPGNGNLYVLGGLDASGQATSTVSFASLSADGSVPAAGAPGTWTATTALPQPLYAAGAVIFHGHLYVVAGADANGAPVAGAWYSKIGADGTLGAWQALPALPVALAHHQLVTAAGSLYVLGGDSAAADPFSNVASASAQAGVYAAKLNIRSGALASAGWIAGSAMGKAREKFSAVAAGSYLLVSGGLYNGASNGSSEQSYAQIAADGSLGSFNGATGSHTISSTGLYDFYNHAAAYFVDSANVPHVIVLGGADVNTGGLHSQTWVQH